MTLGTATPGAVVAEEADVVAVVVGAAELVVVLFRVASS
jgi:hypothetical protein